MIHSIRLVSQKISMFIVVALMMNITAPAYSQSLWERAQAGLSKGASAVGKAVKNIDISGSVQEVGKAIKELDIPGRVQDLAKSTASKINASLSEKLAQLKDKGPQYILSSLLENVDKLGAQVSRVANCMATGNYANQESCSSQDRAALIAVSITVLALTIALIGFTVGIAATSKEVDAQVITVSQEVKGWSPKAVFIRLQNTTAAFKQNITSMQTCLLKRQCTKTQKNILYGTAGTIAALAVIAVGVGIGSYLYNQQKENERTEERKRQAAAEAAAAAAARAAKGLPPLDEGVKGGPLFPEEKPITKPEEKKGIIANLQDQLKSNVASVREQAKAKIANLQELAQDWKSQIKETVTPMQQYFQKNVVEKGTNAFQETAAKIQETLTTQMQLAQQALKETAAEVQATLIEKAQAANAKVKELAQTFFSELQKAGQSFFDIALDKVLNIKLNVVEPTLKKIKEYTARLIAAVKPLETVRLKDQVLQISNDLEALLAKAAQLQNEWQTAASQLAQRTPWIKSHVRPVALGGKTNEQIAAEAKTLYPLAYIADDIWDFYPKLVAKINDLKLYGPALIVESFVKRVADLLDEVEKLHTSMGKIGAVIISKDLANALGNLKTQILRLAADVRSTANVKPLLANPPATTAQLLMEAFKGFVWRVGFGLPNKMNVHLTKMATEFDRIDPLITQITQESGLLSEMGSNISDLLKKDVMKRLESQPIVNSARLPIVLAQSLGLVVSQMKALINDMLTKTDAVIEGFGNVLDEIRPTAELVNNAFGGNFINPALIQGIDKIKSDVQDLRPTIQQVVRGITDAIQIPFGV